MNRFKKVYKIDDIEVEFVYECSQFQVYRNSDRNTCFIVSNDFLICSFVSDNYIEFFEE